MASFTKRAAALGKDPDVIFDAKPVLKALNQLEPGLRKQMLRDMKAITKPAINEIKSVKFTLKNMKNGEQFSVTEDEISGLIGSLSFKK
jgi:hypothetical protein